MLLRSTFVAFCEVDVGTWNGDWASLIQTRFERFEVAVICEGGSDNEKVAT